jgi:exosortase family protein XrtM
MVKDRHFQKKLHLIFQVFRNQIRFILFFVIIFLSLNLCYFLFRDGPLEVFILSELTAKPGATMLGFLFPHDHVIAERNLIISNRISLAMVSGCDATEAILLLVSGICAFSITSKEKLKGVLLGVIFLYATNFVRIAGLYIVGRYDRSITEFAHTYIGQAFMILMAAGFFLFWINRDGIKNAP